MTEAEMEVRNQSDAATLPAAGGRAGTIAHLRWWIIGLIFLVTLMNYLDRLTISVLAPVIRADLSLSNLEYASIGTWFLLAYTISQALSGKLYDRIGTRRGFSVSVTVWSLAAMAHALARGLSSLSFFRFILGLGEAGNWPGAAKAIAEWFPIRERALGMAIFNSGAALGSVVAPPLIVWLQLQYGWQWTFILTGAIGFVWLPLWLMFYRTPREHPRITTEELALICEGQRVADAQVESSVASPRWRELLRYKQVWAIVLARLLVDPIWWLYIFWLPEYLNKAHGFSLKQIGLFAWVPYVAADAGSLLGGWLSGHLIKRGWTANRARKTVIVCAAMLMPAGILAVRADDPMTALALIGLVLFGFQVWINNVQTLPSDFFSDKAVASVAGLGGTGAGIGSMIFTLTTGWVVDHFSYTPILTAAGLLAPIGTIVLFALAGPITRVRVHPIQGAAMS
jgi:ACS family hexuronate transporter-like MFS transporter